MTKFSFTLALESIELSAQGSEFSVNPADFDARSLEAIFIYGTRRWFQDYINAQAHTFRKAAEAGELSGSFDTQAVFASRLEAAKSGELSIRASSAAAPAFSELELATYDLIATPAMRKAHKPLAKAWDSCKGFSSDERRKAMLDALEAMPDSFRLAVTQAAESALATAKALRGIAV